MPAHRASDDDSRVGHAYRFPHEPRHRNTVIHCYADIAGDDLDTHAPGDFRSYTDGYGNAFPDQETFAAKYAEAFGHFEPVRDVDLDRDSVLVYDPDTGFFHVESRTDRDRLRDLDF